MAGMEKFPSGPRAQWVIFLSADRGRAVVPLFHCTMASAALILIFVLHRPTDSIVSGVLLIGLAVFWLPRRG
jgi:hypothetical protein